MFSVFALSYLASYALATPMPAVYPDCTRTFTIHGKDTDESIAAAESITVAKLHALNPEIIDWSAISKQQVICVSRVPQVDCPANGSKCGSKKGSKCGSRNGSKKKRTDIPSETPSGSKCGSKSGSKCGSKKGSKCGSKSGSKCNSKSTCDGKATCTANLALSVRKECGKYVVDSTACVDMGCCWGPVSLVGSQGPWCYLPSVPGESTAKLSCSGPPPAGTTIYRRDCQMTSQITCESVGCCWNVLAPNVSGPNCYYGY